ncbi:glycosyltransferase [Desertivirga arenae]|uniref:glycosyltransferase n=1 Tax=Desertivirga arenae TaxID=2810309 RepID=UPI001A961D8E|nr:glycosyltransferase [Pedobacter sp. SYSU D00823]
MEKKKILIVSRTFYPDNSPRSFRTTELAKEFAFSGHDVTVITPRKEGVHDDFEKQHKLVIKDLGKASWKPVQIAKSGPHRFVTRAVARLTNLFFLFPESEMMFMVNKALKKETELYDVMITIAAPHTVHWGTAMAVSDKHKVAKKWIADCGDPFMGGENDTFKRVFYFKYFEKWFCRKADAITVPISDAITAYYPEFRKKIHVIPQGFRFEDVRLMEEEASNEVPTFAYAGTLIPGIRDPHEFFEFICKSDLKFRFFIYTKNVEQVRKYEAASKGRIVVKAAMPRQDLLQELQKMDFVVNFENKGPKQSPSKLIDYAIIKKPILSVKTFGFNTEAFLEFLEGNYQNQLIIPDADQYRIQNVCRKFLNIV